MKPLLTREQQNQDRREAILDAASRMLRSRGIRASSVSDVMAGAGLTVGGFYTHFRSKEDLFQQALSRTSRQMWTRLLEKAQGETGSARALSVVRRYLSRRLRDDEENGCPMPMTVTEVHHNKEAYLEVFAEELSEYREALARLWGDDAKAHRERALALIALMYGALSISRSLRGHVLSDEVLKAAKDLASEALVD